MVIPPQDAYVQWRKDLIHWARRFTRNPEDAVQRAFVQYCAAWEQVENPLAWLMSATRFAALMELRGASRRTSAYDAYLNITPRTTRTDPITCIFAHQTYAYLLTLPYGDLAAQSFLGDTPTELAPLHNTTPSAIKNRVLRIRRELKALEALA